MPAAAVIPAPMAYLPIVAVEALVAPVARTRFERVLWRHAPLGAYAAHFPVMAHPLTTHPEECHVKAPDRAFVACSGAREPSGPTADGLWVLCPRARSYGRPSVPC